MEDANDVSQFDLKIDHQVSRYLGETAKWARFMSFIGFAFCGLIFIYVFFLRDSTATTISNLYGSPGLSGSAFSTIIYIGIGLSIFFAAIFLFNFSKKMKSALQTNDQRVLGSSFKSLRSFFKFQGILAIISISFYTLIIVFAIAAVIVGRH